jgi:hypothetical protein
VTVKTLHGEFEFAQQMYQGAEGTVGFIELTERGENRYVSRGLQELVGYYSNRLSYEEVSGLLERVSGKASLSAQGIWNTVHEHVQVLSEQLTEEYKLELEAEQPTLDILTAVELDVYDGAASEILLFEDGILVKKQKEKRENPDARLLNQASSGDSQKKRQNVLSDVVLLEISPGQFEYLLPPINAEGEFRMPLHEVILQRINHYYGSWTKPLPLVVISDGAKSIRNRLERMFGLGVCVILDWYHLSQKIRDLMSMIGQNKAEKTTHINQLLNLLWQGKAAEAITYLNTQVKVRNPEKQQELLTYLEKHQAEIIDYERRRQAGKSIGSGRMEKAVDQVIGHRQKRKGMSWRPQGSRGLALLKVLELNGGWQEFWFPSTNG